MMCMKSQPQTVHTSTHLANMAFTTYRTGVDGSATSQYGTKQNCMQDGGPQLVELEFLSSGGPALTSRKELGRCPSGSTQHGIYNTRYQASFFILVCQSKARGPRHKTSVDCMHVAGSHRQATAACTMYWCHPSQPVVPKCPQLPQQQKATTSAD